MGAHGQLSQVFAHPLFKRPNFGKSVVRGDLDKVHYVMLVQIMPHPAAHIPFGINHLIRPQLFQHAAVNFVVGPGDDGAHAHFLQKQGDHAAGLDLVADGHHGHVEISYAQIPQYALFRRVGTDRVGGIAHRVVDPILANIHRQHLRAVFIQRFAYGPAKPAQTDDYILLFSHRHIPFELSLRRFFLPGGGFDPRSAADVQWPMSATAARCAPCTC